MIKHRPSKYPNPRIPARIERDGWWLFAPRRAAQRPLGKRNTIRADFAPADKRHSPRYVVEGLKRDRKIL